MLYTALINVAAGEDFTDTLTTCFLKSERMDENRNQVYLYSGLYLTNDENNLYHEYTYASRMKLLAAIDAKQLDIVLMNREAFDAFSQNGYLCNLDELLSVRLPDRYDALKPLLVKNIVILEDNSIDMALGNESEYHAETKEGYLGIDLSGPPSIQSAGFEDTVYLGVLKNSSRTDMVLSYIEYLCT